MKTIINENQRGLLFKNGKLVKLLGAGKHYTFGDSQIEILSITEPVHSENCTLETLLKNEEIAACTQSIEVEDGKIALRFTDGIFAECLRRGRYAFWNIDNQHSFKIIDITAPEVPDDISVQILMKMPTAVYTFYDIGEFQKGLLYYDNKFVRLLDSGRYFFWRNNVNVRIRTLDTRLKQISITGQEILTSDKVSLRISCVCGCRIKDCIRVVSDVEDYEEQLHVAAQLAMREYVGRYTLDEILENKEKFSEFLLDSLRIKGEEIFVEITEAGIKDIILPGEIREIMNTVLVAQKRAQANVITRREEVASTRSLLNTAKLMDENTTLYKLKELEYLERICENVGNINVSNNGDIISQLTKIITGKE